MTRSDYVKDQIENRWPEQFKNHVATMQSLFLDDPGRHGTPIVWLEWRSPRTWTYACRYMIDSQWLFAYGDLFEATYQWGGSISLEFLAGLNFDYFLGKCRASPDGRNWETWHDDVARTELNRIRDLTKADEYPNQKEFEWTRNVLDCGASREEVEYVAQQIYDKTGDAEWAGEIKTCGMTPDTMAIGHFVGIKMAYQQLTKGSK